MKKLNVLFICSRNQWRSPTAETIFRDHPKLNTRSAGTASNARRNLQANDIHWADVIMVMEEEHKLRIKANFKHEIGYKSVHILDIPDNYGYMDNELIELLKTSVPFLLGLEK